MRTMKLNENNRATPFCIRLADTVIRIAPMFEYIREYCRDYITEEQASFTVRTEPGDISFERERSAKEAEREGRVDGIYSDAYLETLTVYRKERYREVHPYKAVEGTVLLCYRPWS